MMAYKGYTDRINIVFFLKQLFDLGHRSSEILYKIDQTASHILRNEHSLGIDNC